MTKEQERGRGQGQGRRQGRGLCRSKYLPTNIFEDFFSGNLDATFRTLFNEVCADRKRVLDVFDNSTRYPKADARETSTGYEIDLAVPGCVKEDVEIVFENQLLTVKYEKTNQKKSGDKLLFNELRHSSWSRGWTISAEIKEEEISASLINGILTVVVPFKQLQVEEESKPRKILIRESKKCTCETKKKQ